MLLSSRVVSSFLASVGGLGLLLIANVAGAANPEIQVPADPNARYEVQELKKRYDGLLEITTKRVGASGISYSKGLVDCARMQMKLLGEGRTLGQVARARPSPSMNDLTPGSSAHAAAVYACGSMP